MAKYLYVAGKSDTTGRSSSGGELDELQGGAAILERRNPVGIAKLRSVPHKTRRLDGDVLRFENEVLDSRSNMLWVRPSYPEMCDAVVWKAGVQGGDGEGDRVLPCRGDRDERHRQVVLRCLAAYRADHM